MERNVVIKELKEFAEARLARYPLTRDILLSERDELPVDEFVSRAALWLRLLKSETR